MTISVVGTNTGHTVSSSEQLIVNLPAGVIENDIVLVAVGGSRSNWAVGVLTDGYEEIAELYATSTNTINLSLNWKRMGATPDVSVQCLASGQTSTDLLCIVYVLRGVNTTTALDVTSTTATGSGSHDPNPPAITPITSDAFIVICGACSNYAASGGDTSVTAPSGYTNQVLLPSTNVTNDSTLMMASKAWTIGTEDPGAWNVDVGIDGADAWAAVTVAFRPIVSASLELESLAILVTGESSTLTFYSLNRDFSLDTLDYILSGLDPILEYGALPTEGTGSPLTDILSDEITDSTGEVITTLADYVVDAALKTFLVTGSSAQLFKPGVAYVCIASPGVKSVTGFPVTVVRKYVPSTLVASFSVSGSPAEMLAVGVTPLLLYANLGEMSVEGLLTTLVSERLTELETESHNTSGINAILTKAGILQAESGALIVGGAAVSISGTSLIEASETYVWVEGYDTDLTLTTVWDLFAAPGSYVISGANLSIIWPYELNALGGTYVVSGSLMYIIRSTDISRSNRYHLKDVTPRRIIKVIDPKHEAEDVTPIRILELV